MSVEILPDSRPRDRKGAVQSKDGWWIPIYCANCGREWGMVPEKLITFAFALCDPCSEKHGDPAHFYKEPDAVFWERVQLEMVDKRIDSLTEIQLQAHVDDASSSIGKLLRERVTLVERES